MVYIYIWWALKRVSKGLFADVAWLDSTCPVTYSCLCISKVHMNANESVHGLLIVNVKYNMKVMM